MTKKRKDTDYLFLSARVRTMERRLLSASQLERMLLAADGAEAVRVLTDAGYAPFDPQSDEGLRRALLEEREKLFRELGGYAESRELTDVFRLKYDYHNVKVLLKSPEAERLLVDAGRVDAGTLSARHRESGAWDFLPPVLAHAAAEAERVLRQTNDPQRSDFLLDSAYFAELTSLAKESRCEYLQRYVRAMIDAANLRSAIRTLRLGKPGNLLKELLVEGGSLSAEKVLTAAINRTIAATYHPTAFAAAAEEGENVVRGGSLTRFEKLCDEAVNRCVAEAKYVPFGPEVVIGYLAAKESELTSVRIIMAGRMAGLSTERIRERLREVYV